MKALTSKFAILAGAALLAASMNSADAIVFFASDGSAKVEVTSVANGPNTDVTVVLTNTTPTASTQGAVNLLTGVSFTPTDISTFTLNSQSAAQSFHFNTSTTGTVGGAIAPNWELVADPTGRLFFGGFGGGTPGAPIIGPAASDTTYANAGSSLTSGPHGDYAYKSATFNLSVAGSFNANTLTGATFYFNTDGGTKVNCLDCGGATPEPASLGVLGLGAAALLLRRKKA